MEHRPFDGGATCRDVRKSVLATSRCMIKISTSTEGVPRNDGFEQNV